MYQIKQLYLHTYIHTYIHTYSNLSNKHLHNFGSLSLTGHDKSRDKQNKKPYFDHDVVPLERIDDLELSKVDLMKIDAQGMEPEVCVCVFVCMYVCVRVIIDDLELSKVDLMKIDAQGMEPEVCVCVCVCMST